MIFSCAMIHEACGSETFSRETHVKKNYNSCVFF